MKSSLTITLLTIAVSQVMAVVPIPIKECTKTVVVDPKYDACTDFARDFNITFKDLLQYNEKLRKDCMNLDTGEKMCVSINPGGINPPLVPMAKKEKTIESDADAGVTTDKKKKKDDEGPKDGKVEGRTGETAKPANAQEKKPVAKTDLKKDTPAAAVVPPTLANGVSNAASTTLPNKQQQNIFINGVGASAVGTTSSMMLAAAGVVFSVIYML